MTVIAVNLSSRCVCYFFSELSPLLRTPDVIWICHSGRCGVTADRLRCLNISVVMQFGISRVPNDVGCGKRQLHSEWIWLHVECHGHSTLEFPGNSAMLSEEFCTYLHPRLFPSTQKTELRRSLKYKVTFSLICLLHEHLSFQSWWPWNNDFLYRLDAAACYRLGSAVTR